MSGVFYTKNDKCWVVYGSLSLSGFVLLPWLLSPLAGGAGPGLATECVPPSPPNAPG